MDKKIFPIAYAAYNKNLDIRMVSTSGGVFTVIAEHLIDTDKAAVYGAAFDDEFNVRHVRVETKEELGKLRGSKYPQSHIGKCYKLAKEDLENGRTVLFVGTPCQIVGLKNVLGKDFDRLFTMDFVCHGVASDLIWREYVHELSRKGKIREIIFKFKYKGWKKWYFHVNYENGSWQRRGHITKFMNSYLSYANIRPSCYECKFKGIAHASDFTISDCWGIAERDVDINDNRGLSALLIQNERAEALFSTISPLLVTKEYDAYELMEGNWTAFRCVPRPAVRVEFFKEVERTSGMKALDIYFTPTIKQWIIYYVQRMRGKER